MNHPGCPACGGIAICLITEEAPQGRYTRDDKIERQYYRQCPDCGFEVMGKPHKNQLPAYTNFWKELGVVV